MKFVIFQANHGYFKSLIDGGADWAPTRRAAQRFESRADAEAMLTRVNIGEVKELRPIGFAALPREQVAEIARKGGKAAHEAGTAHEFTSEEGSAAGRKGGMAAHARRRQARERAAE